MLSNPILNSAYFSAAHQTNITQQTSTKHRKMASTSNINSVTGAVGMMPLLYPVSSLDPFTNDPNSNYDGSSRSTSAYSVMPDTAAPILHKGVYHPTPGYPQTYTEALQRQLNPATRGKQQLSIRLPSDQIEKIISALGPRTQAQQITTPTTPDTSMPPPPIPQRAPALSNNTALENSTAPDNSTEKDSGPTTQSQLSQAGGNAINRRGESGYSDVSMHNNCTSFPTCTHEDGEGRLIHNAPTAPATVVKGKKEGSSAAKRKLSLSAKQNDDQTEKKRPRRSARFLQHDSGFDSGPSSDLNHNTNNNNGAAGGDEPAVVESDGRAGQEADESGAQVAESE